MNPFKVVDDFEAELAAFTGAPYAVTTTSCTMAIFLALRAIQDVNGYVYGGLGQISIPRHTYVGVAMSVLNVGANIDLRDEAWTKYYRIGDGPLYDSARYLRRNMWGEFDQQGIVCLSFHWNKPLGIGQGGALLVHSPVIANWFKAARFDGRDPGTNVWENPPTMVGYHAYMRPEDAAAGLVRLSHIGDGNNGLIRPAAEEYPDLGQMPFMRQNDGTHLLDEVEPSKALH